MEQYIPAAVIIIAALIIISFIGKFIKTINRIRALEQHVDETEADIDVALTKRFDVLTKELDVVKGYKTHEMDVIYNTIRLRSGMTMDEKNTAAASMDKIDRQIKVTAEAYPQLRSSENFIMLQKTIRDTEEHLQASRRLYNSAATEYNTAIVMFPDSVAAGLIGAKHRPLFSAEPGKRRDVSMEF